MRETMIGNPTGKSLERRQSNPNEGFGDWKNAMSEIKPPTAEERAAQIAQAREYDAAMVQSVRERMKDQPSRGDVHNKPINLHHAGTFKAFDLDKHNADKAEEAARKAEEEKKKPWYKKMFKTQQ